MKVKRVVNKIKVGLCAGLLFLIPNNSVNALYSNSSKVQFGNTISGFVYGLQRQGINDVTVELLDDLSRTVARTRTSGAGRYFFSGIRAGRYQIRALPLGTDYEEQTQEVEIDNLQVQSSNGVRTIGYDNKQQDLFLKIRKDKKVSGVTGTVFVQDVPQPAKAKFDEGISALNNQKHEEAIVHLQKAVDIFSDYFSALQRLGLEYIEVKRFDKAEQILSKAVKINSRDFRSWYGLAYAHYSLKHKDEAVTAATKAVELNSTSTDALMLYGVSLKRVGEYQKAELNFKKADELSKGDLAEVHWQLALLYGNNLEQYSAAAGQLELFLKKQPNSKDKENILKLITIFREKAKAQKQD